MSAALACMNQLVATEVVKLGDCLNHVVVGDVFFGHGQKPIAGRCKWWR